MLRELNLSLHFFSLIGRVGLDPHKTILEGREVLYNFPPSPFIVENPHKILSVNAMLLDLCR